METNKGKLQFEAEGKTIYANLDSLHDPNPARTKAMRKVVRLIIEKSGHGGKTFKREVETNYRKGKVWWEDERVAEWDEMAGQMRLAGVLREWTDEYKRMMGEE